MKNRTSTPVDVLNALVSPITWVGRISGAFGSPGRRRNGSNSGGPAVGNTGCEMIFFPRKVLADVADLAGIVEQHEPHRTGDR